MFSFIFLFFYPFQYTCFCRKKKVAWIGLTSHYTLNLLHDDNEEKEDQKTVFLPVARLHMVMIFTLIFLDHSFSDTMHAKACLDMTYQIWKLISFRNFFPIMYAQNSHYSLIFLDLN